MPLNFSKIFKEILKIAGGLLFEFIAFIVTENLNWIKIFYVITLFVVIVGFLYYHLTPVESEYKKFRKTVSIIIITALFVFLAFLSYSDFSKMVSGKETPQTPTITSDHEEKPTEVDQPFITTNPPIKIITPTQEFPRICISNSWKLTPENLNNESHVSLNQVCPDYSLYGFIGQESGLKINIDNSPINTNIIGIYKIINDDQYTVTLKISNWENGIQNNKGHFYFGFCEHTKIPSCITEFLNIGYVGDALKPEIYVYDNISIHNVTNSEGEIVIVCDKYPDEVICEFPFGTDTRTIPIGNDPDSIFLGYDITEGSTIDITIKELTISPLR